MNRKTIVVLLLLTLLILAGAPESFARPQYLTNLTAVYGGGTCGTCHVIASGSGMRNTSGMFGQNNSNGPYVPRNSSRTPGQRRSNGTFGMRNRTLPLNSYGTLFENQPDHATDPGAALMAIGQPPAATATQGDTPADTAPAGAPSTPGFGIVLSLIGLIACVLLARRHNK
ncbi:MAG: PGF-CTERM sorting domain-containing protein [Candidatus Methanoperedens sp.]|nr:PGF-CTERM sorting domain-containing protein [Candidatus Methanoperedens sp.]